MDVQLIGKFLADLRREKGLTQEQLGERLGVTNKTVSRWENGNYLPPVEILQMLSQYYGLTINEILSAQRLSPEKYREKAEENIKSALGSSTFTLKEKIAFYKRKWLRDNRFCFVLDALVLIAAAVAVGLYFETWLLNVLAVLAIVRAAHHRNQMMIYIASRAYDGSGNQ